MKTWISHLRCISAFDFRVRSTKKTLT